MFSCEINVIDPFLQKLLAKCDLNVKFNVQKLQKQTKIAKFSEIFRIKFLQIFCFAFRENFATYLVKYIAKYSHQWVSCLVFSMKKIYSLFFSWYFAKKVARAFREKYCMRNDKFHGFSTKTLTQTVRLSWLIKQNILPCKATVRGRLDFGLIRGSSRLVQQTIKIIIHTQIKIRNMWCEVLVLSINACAWNQIFSLK